MQIVLVAVRLCLCGVVCLSKGPLPLVTMADATSDDLTVASILTHLQHVSSRDAEAEKLYKLCVTLEGERSRERKTLLRQLCSQTQWNISLREGGKNKGVPAI
jgi:hypothetical protein